MLIQSKNIKSYIDRRYQVQSLVQDGIIVIPNATQKLRNRDIAYPYRFDSYFYYLSGFVEPESLICIIAGNTPKSILFCREKNAQRERWEGFSYGTEEAKAVFAFDEVYDITLLDQIIPQLFVQQDRIFFPFSAGEKWEMKIMQWVREIKKQSRQGICAPRSIEDICVVLDELRLIKSHEEIEMMRQAAAISATAHLEAMRQVKSVKTEYEVEAILMREFYRQAASNVAYPSIVASGKNACVLHYQENNAQLQVGDLLLIDAGCEWQGYASDITRTFPVNGRFSTVQKDCYDLVLLAQQGAIAEMIVGNSCHAPHQRAVKILTQGFIDLGLIKESLDEALEKETYRQFYMHRTGHWLGLDVHDVGEYKNRHQKDRAFEAGMVMTVEPGCYISPAEGVPEHFWNIGVRIEDDVVISETKVDILSKDAPKTVPEIESAISGEI